MSVEHDKDADENVDADQTSTGRPVSGQSIGLFTQLEEIDIDFRVSGLPHAVVVNTIPPIQQNPMQNGYDESYENKCATNYIMSSDGTLCY